MIVKIKSENIAPLLDIEKHGNVYLLGNVKKLDYGFSCKLKWMKKEFNVLASVKSNSVEIIEEDGKFYITITFKNKEASIDLRCTSIYAVVLKPLVWRLAKNLEKYSEYVDSVKTTISKSQKSSLLEIFEMKPSISLDLRGTICPVPEIESKKLILKAKPYETIEVLVDHPAAVLYTLPEVARTFGCKYFVRNMGDYASFVFICGRKEDFQLDLSDVKNLMRNESSIAKLYLYFDKIVKQIKVDHLDQELLSYEGLTLIVASPEGRGWLLTALEENGKIISARLDYGNIKLFDDDAINMINNFNGLINIYYLKK
ncbi:hypothetical protein DFR86_11055 [Acidianus sulfidivorans JP7]|uniref:UPF0033 domain-containing protein n=1 Tax=Acidianus sulfidivorans JP7 TaxID=619593 RepID=A0A2U9IPP0_9CREN|nr:sulfurtransferase TusA family protein [Acidianus sulfidivorans]AWR98019.1 hypothetical protein DFR86_11055 [Acidianus sulfidivorans JP7]